MAFPEPTLALRRSSAARHGHAWPGKLLGPLAVAFFLLALLLVCFFLYTRNNAFPFYWHIDEESKAQQLLTDSRNYNHPQLLLEVTYWVIRWVGLGQETQAIVEVGRSVSAAFMATAVVALAWAAYCTCRWSGLLLSALGMALCPTMLAYSHYMKEDAALIMGLALVVAACRAVWDWRNWYTRALALAFLGVACGVAASGKYLGALTLAIAVVAILLAPGVRWRSLPLRAAVVCLFFVATVLMVNHRAVDWRAIQEGRISRVEDLFTAPAREGFAREFQHGMNGHARATMDQPNTYALGVLCRETSWHVFVLSGAFALLPFLPWRGRSGWDLLMLWYLLLCLAVLSFNTIPFHRYAQPAVFLAYFLASLGLAGLVRRFCPGSLRQAAAVVIALDLLLVLQLPRALHYLQQFRESSRDHLYAWAVAELPKNANVIVEYYAGLGIGPGGYRDRNLPERPDLSLSHDTFAPNQGSLEELCARPGTYVIVCDMAYERYQNASLRPIRGSEQDFAFRRNWYQQLFRDYHPIWSCQPEYNMHENASPAIAVYHLGK